MGASAGVALKSLQWFVRGIQFLCAALILALFSYFLATLHNHSLSIPNWIRAVEGISGAAVLYTIIGLLLLCCLAGRAVSSAIAILLDIAFAGAFIYVAVANRGGASSCRGTVSTAFGTGNADTNVSDNGNAGFTNLPSFRQACRMHTACLAVAIVAIIFFLLSALLEVALVRNHRKERRFGPSPANDYTSGYGKGRTAGAAAGGGLLGRFSRKRRTGLSEDQNALPTHTHPNQVRDSYATEQTRVGTAGGVADPAAANYNKHGESGFGHHNHHNSMNNVENTAATTGQYRTLDPAAAPGTAMHYPSHPGVGNTQTYGETYGTPVQPRADYPSGNYQYEDGTYTRAPRV